MNPFSQLQPSFTTSLPYLTSKLKVISPARTATRHATSIDIVATILISIQWHHLPIEITSCQGHDEEKGAAGIGIETELEGKGDATGRGRGCDTCCSPAFCLVSLFSSSAIRSRYYKGCFGSKEAFEGLAHGVIVQNVGPIGAFPFPSLYRLFPIICPSPFRSPFPRFP
ncbi:hypothetical protein FIBSPDRAFT_883726 [Athelia psychrophila]|uniref:Uncharacterized protein n=1 Tax=Athelia psychrophila TaxID=1759441 RepID=A0A166TVE4_9AGAM|nr:hypothetical protein FIBSPDRAFT_883726 [Fibularhizoctonia sp. CBS 109695]